MKMNGKQELLEQVHAAIDKLVENENIRKLVKDARLKSINQKKKANSWLWDW